MSENNTNTENKTTKVKEPLFTGKKIAKSLLAGFTVPFVYIICSTCSVYFTNASQFKFSVGDFLPTLIWIALGVFAAISAVLIFTKGLLHDTLFAVVSGITTAAMIQNFITNLTFKGLPGDGNVAATPEWLKVLNFLLWAAIIVGAVWFGVASKYEKTGKFVLTYLLALVLIMQLASVVPSYITYLGSDKTADTEESGTTVTDEDGKVIPEEELMRPYLSTNNVFEVSEKDNVIVFVLDRFDADYYDRLLKSNPDVTDKLDGFTYYSDNVSLYPRTYPAVTSMVTGVDQDFTQSRSNYLKGAFTDSTFLQDLKDNNYKINLYISEYYSYDSVDTIKGLVDNYYQPVKEDVKVESKTELAKTMFKTGAYFWVPEVLKPQDVSTRTINEQVKRAGEYVLDDPKLYEEFTESGLYTQDDKGTFMFLHMRGCHSPFNMDENCQLVEESNNLSDGDKQTEGCFKFVTEYIDQLKALGLYEDATIIITGDHAALSSDYDLYKDENLTALLVKESGKSGTPLKTSDVPVSQENFLATIVKSAGIETEEDYGKAYSEETNDPDKVRYHYFQTAPYASAKNYLYEIKGSGKDFSNWTIVSEEEIGSLY